MHHHGLDLSQQWTIPHNAIWTNQHIHQWEVLEINQTVLITQEIFYFQMALEEGYWTSPSLRGNHSSRDNGHSAYQIRLENFEPVLETSTYLINRLIGQFHAVYNDGYCQMATIPMIWSTWREGQLVTELNKTRTCFGLPPTNTPVKKPAVCQQVPAAVVQRSQSRFQQAAPEDVAVPELTNQPPHSRTVEYLEPSFSLERPVRRLKMDKRLEVHNNFISAISNKMHKVDLICRLKKSEPHNAAHYQEQLNQQLTRHYDVIHHLMDIMKTDDYFR